MTTRYEAPEEEVQFAAVAVSSLGKFVYGAALDGSLHVFDYDTAERMVHFAVHSKDVASVAVHPHSNVVATISYGDFSVNCWRPERIQ